MPATNGAPNIIMYFNCESEVVSFTTSAGTARSPVEVIASLMWALCEHTRQLLDDRSEDRNNDTCDLLLQTANVIISQLERILDSTPGKSAFDICR